MGAWNMRHTELWDSGNSEGFLFEVRYRKGNIKMNLGEVGFGERI
jgi:hypothetical protein